MAASLYERAGGALAMRAIVVRLYRYILADQDLAPFFKTIDMDRLRRAQEAFVSYAFGAGEAYTGRSMRDAHRDAVSRGLNDQHFDLVAGYLVLAMKNIGLSQEIIDEAIAIVAPTRDDVLNR